MFGGACSEREWVELSNKRRQREEGVQCCLGRAVRFGAFVTIPLFQLHGVVLRDTPLTAHLTSAEGPQKPLT